MMDFPPILAADDGGDLIRLLVGAAFVVFWILVGLASNAKKKKPGQQQDGGKSWEDMLRELTGVEMPKPQEPEPPPLPPRQQMPPAPPPQPPRPQRQRPKPEARRPVPKRPAPKPPRPVSVAPPLPQTHAVSEPAQTVESTALSAGTAFARHSDIADTEITSETKSATSSAKTPLASARAISGWLNPGTLRSQFILTEILQPPLAMRPDERR